MSAVDLDTCSTPAVISSADATCSRATAAMPCMASVDLAIWTMARLSSWRAPSAAFTVFSIMAPASSVTDKERPADLCRASSSRKPEKIIPAAPTVITVTRTTRRAVPPPSFIMSDILRPLPFAFIGSFFSCIQSILSF